jgi:hypothetical protein
MPRSDVQSLPPPKEMPTSRETILAALHARLSALPATTLRGEMLPERVPAEGLLILRDGKRRELDVVAARLPLSAQRRDRRGSAWGIGRQGLGEPERLAPSRYRPVKRHMQPLSSRPRKVAGYQWHRTLGVNPATPKLRREMPLRRAKTGFRRPSHPQPHAKNPQISWDSTWPTGMERKVGWWSLERAMGFEPTTPTLARLCSTPELRPRSVPP